jgi:hypothetical protein
MQFSNSNLQFRSKDASFTICTKLMIEIQRQKCQVMQNVYIFLYFQYIETKNAWTKK